MLPSREQGDPLGPMQRAAVELWAPGSYWHPGGLAWRARDLRGGPSQVLTLSGPVGPGWGWIEDGGHLNALVGPEDADGARLLAEWCVDTPAVGSLTAEVPSGARALRTALLAHGFTEAPQAPFSLDLRCAAGDVTGPPWLPGGYVVRPLADGEQDALVACHRASWDPHLLPWPASARPELPATAASPFSAEHLALVESTWPYRRELVLVVQAPGGALAASCIAWLDDHLGVAEVEPLGVVPAHRGLGLGRALCAAAGTAVAAAGGHELTIHARGDAGYPAARRLYERCGFRAVACTVPYVRPSR